MILCHDVPLLQLSLSVPRRLRKLRFTPEFITELATKRALDNSGMPEYNRIGQFHCFSCWPTTVGVTELATAGLYGTPGTQLQQRRQIRGCYTPMKT